MSRHGPGPWKIARGYAQDSNGGPPFQTVVIVDRDGRIVADGVTTDNLPVIVEAAEMVDLLRVFSDPARPATTCNRTGVCPCEIHAARRVIARIDEPAPSIR